MKTKEIDQLRAALIAVMDATGMNETAPATALGKCGKCYESTITPRVKICRKCAAVMAREALDYEHGIATMLKLISNEEQLEAELDEGEKYAIALVDHLERMGAGGCSIPIFDRDEEMVVVVMDRYEWEEKMLKPGTPNPFD